MMYVLIMCGVCMIKTEIHFTILDSHSSVDEDSDLLRCYAMLLGK